MRHKFFIKSVVLTFLAFTLITQNTISQASLLRFVPIDEPTLIFKEAETGLARRPIIPGISKDGTIYLFTDPTGPRKNVIEAPFAGRAGSVKFSFSITETGFYRLFARVYYPDEHSNSFYALPHETSPAILGDSPGPFQSWHWIRGLKYFFKQGEHSLRIQIREHGTRLDKILIANVPDSMLQLATIIPDGFISKEAKLVTDRLLLDARQELRGYVCPPASYHLFAPRLSYILWIENSEQRIILRDSASVASQFIWNPNQLPDGLYQLNAKIYQQQQLLAQVSQQVHIVAEPIAELEKQAQRFPDTMKRYLATFEYGLKSMKAAVETNDFKSFKQKLKTMKRIIRAIQAGEDPYQNLSNPIEKAFRSQINGHVMPYLIAIPPNYEKQANAPILIYLHDNSGDYQSFFDSRNQTDWQFAVEQGFFILSPALRHKLRFSGAAELDLLQLINEIKIDYAIDDKRIYLTGEGSGVYLLALNYPGLFAAIAPVSGGADLDLVENLKHTPIFHFCEATNRKANQRLHFMQKEIEKLGYDYQQKELSGSEEMSRWSVYRGGKFKSLLTWFKAKKCRKHPDAIDFSTKDLRHNRSYWLEIMAFERYNQSAHIEAEIMSHNHIKIHSENVSALRLHFSGAPIDSSKKIAVTWNHSQKYFGPYRAEISLKRETFRQSRLSKQPGLSGPLKDIFYDKIMYVYGTQGWSSRQLQANQKAAKLMSQQNFGRSSKYHEAVPVKKDTEVTQKDLEEFNLILLGGPKSNSLTAKIEKFMPFLNLARDFFQIGNLIYSDDNLGCSLIYPNPLNSQRYVILNFGLSPKGIENIVTHSLNSTENDLYQAPGGNKQSVWGQADFVIFDDYGFTNHGYFNQQWEVDIEQGIASVKEKFDNLDPERYLDAFQADAIVENLEVDVALLMRGNPRSHLDPEPVSRLDIIGYFQKDKIFRTNIHGTRLLQMLEFQLDVLDEPLSIFGIKYQYDPQKAYGTRIVKSNIDSLKSYQLALTEPICIDSERIFNYRLDCEYTGKHLVDIILDEVSKRRTLVRKHRIGVYRVDE